jgi:hypothetical protein
MARHIFIGVSDIYHDLDSCFLRGVLLVRENFSNISSPHPGGKYFTCAFAYASGLKMTVVLCASDIICMIFMLDPPETDGNEAGKENCIHTSCRLDQLLFIRRF